MFVNRSLKYLLLCTLVLVSLGLVMAACGGGGTAPAVDSGGAVEPAQETILPSKTAFDLLIARDESLSVDKFHSWRSDIVEGLLENSVFASNLTNWFNIYYATDSGLVELSGSGSCPKPELKSDLFVKDGDFKIIPDMIVVLHDNNAYQQDCAWTYPHVVTSAVRVEHLAQSKCVFVHEIAHGFGLPDEYDRAPSYWEQPPVIYHTQQQCADDQANKSWCNECTWIALQQFHDMASEPSYCEPLCTNLATCRENGEGICLNTESWEECKLERNDKCIQFWRSEEYPDLMSDLSGDDVPEFGQGDWINIHRYLAKLKDELAKLDSSSPRTISEPEAFAPTPWATTITAASSISMYEVTEASAAASYAAKSGEQAADIVGIIALVESATVELQLDARQSFITDTYYAPNIPDVGPLGVELRLKNNQVLATDILDPRGVRVYDYDTPEKLHIVLYDVPPVYVDGTPWDIIIPFDDPIFDEIDLGIEDLSLLHIYDQYWPDIQEPILVARISPTEQFIQMESIDPRIEDNRTELGTNGQVDSFVIVLDPQTLVTNPTAILDIGGIPFTVADLTDASTINVNGVEYEIIPTTSAYGLSYDLKRIDGAAFELNIAIDNDISVNGAFAEPLAGP